MKTIGRLVVGSRLLLVFAVITIMNLMLVSCDGGGSTPAVTYSISGQVTLNGAGLTGVTMTLGGAGSASTTSDASGNYTLSGVANGSYTITPSKTGFAFTPINSPQTISGANITSVNFTAAAVPTFSISGSVKSGGSGLSGVTMTLSGAGSASTTSDASGDFTFNGLPNGNYTITPSKTGYTFTPASSPQTVSSANITSIDFTATSTVSARIVACPASVTDNVTIQDFSFTQSAITVSVNDIVKWTNNGASTHTVTSGNTPNSDGKFNSGNLGTGSTVCVQFMAIGSYPYFCALHPFMTGSVTVQ